MRLVLLCKYTNIASVGRARARAASARASAEPLGYFIIHFRCPLATLSHAATGTGAAAAGPLYAHQYVVQSVPGVPVCVLPSLESLH